MFTIGIHLSKSRFFHVFSIHFPGNVLGTGPRGKPVLASWMGGPDVAPGAKVLNDAGIPTYAYPDMAP
jgi:hypothetical protein